MCPPVHDINVEMLGQLLLRDKRKETRKGLTNTDHSIHLNGYTLIPVISSRNTGVSVFAKSRFVAAEMDMTTITCLKTPFPNLRKIKTKEK